MKVRNKKGFTLAELLIVIAIIGVLVAVSVPIFKGKIIKAKIATNQANARSAKAAAIAEYLTTGVDKAYYEYTVETGTLTYIDERAYAADISEIPDRKMDILEYFYIKVNEDGEVSLPYDELDEYDISDPELYK